MQTRKRARDNETKKKMSNTNAPQHESNKSKYTGELRINIRRRLQRNVR